MSRIAVLTDSGCDVFASDREKYNIHVLPLKITYSDGTFTDNVDIQPRDIYDRFPAQIPKTSTPNIQEVLDEVERIRAEGCDQIIAICISSGLSGTYNTVCAHKSTHIESVFCTGDNNFIELYCKGIAVFLCNCSIYRGASLLNNYSILVCSHIFAKNYSNF